MLYYFGQQVLGLHGKLIKHFQKFRLDTLKDKERRPFSFITKYEAINNYGDCIKIPDVDDQTPEEAFIKTRSYIEKLYQQNQLTSGGH
ncbi:hypothetical protein [Bacillus cereus]|uniref:hypothetical protein n=1 Tax=Bacillus cereus TaxID=1396 RepID=UPI0019547E80|nr:hypothetical protein [Bacillus cereus]